MQKEKKEILHTAFMKRFWNVVQTCFWPIHERFEFLERILLVIYCHKYSMHPCSTHFVQRGSKCNLSILTTGSSSNLKKVNFSIRIFTIKAKLSLWIRAMEEEITSKRRAIFWITPVIKYVRWWSKCLNSKMGEGHSSIKKELSIKSWVLLWGNQDSVKSVTHWAIFSYMKIIR